MIIRQGFRFRLEPTPEQAQFMARIAGCCRFVWNQALAVQRERHAQERPTLAYKDLCRLLTEWRNSEQTAFLAEAPVHTQQQSLKDLERAYVNFFQQRAQFPNLKKKGRADHFRFPDPKQIKLNLSHKDADGRYRLPQIFLPKIGWTKFRGSREIVGEIKNATVRRAGHHWYLAIQTEREVPEPCHPSETSVGIDLGVCRFATLSDGQVFEPLSIFKKVEAKLAQEQRKLSRKRKFSKNWLRQKERVRRHYEHMAAARADFQHKVSTTISKNHALVAMEDLKVSAMTSSGTRKGLRTAILNQGWYAFRQMLAYKLAWAGGHLIIVSPSYTSCTCFKCGHIAKGNRRDQAMFVCRKCGHSDHADLNAARNIQRAGHARLACSSG